MLSKKDPITGDYSYVVRYTVEEGGTWRYVGCASSSALFHAVKDLQEREDVHCIEIYDLSNRYRKMTKPHWVTEI